MQETITTCDACGKKLKKQEDLLIYETVKADYDLCLECGKKLIDKTLESMVLRKNCDTCLQTGKLKVIDDDASEDSCGENRTAYKTVECHNCFHG